MAYDKGGDVIDVEVKVVHEDPPAAGPTEVVEAVQLLDPTTILPALVASTEIAKINPAIAALDALKAKIAAELPKLDINTKAGEERFRQLRQECIKLRTSTKDAYEAWNKPLLEAQRGTREVLKKVDDGIKPQEDALAKAIKARDDAREAERLRKVAEEEAKIAALREKITAITKIPAAAVKMSAAEIEQQLLDLQAMAINDTPESFGEFSDEAGLLRNETITTLNEMLVAKQRDEAERLRLDTAAAELRAQQAKDAATAALRRRIDAIKARAFDAMGKSAKQIGEILSSVQALEPVVIEFGDLYAEAHSAWDGVVSMLKGAQTAQVQTEAQAAEQQRVANEQAERQRALDDEERKRQEAAQEAERKAAAAAAPQPAAEEPSTMPAGERGDDALDIAPSSVAPQSIESLAGAIVVHGKSVMPLREELAAHVEGVALARRCVDALVVETEKTGLDVIELLLSESFLGDLRELRHAIQQAHAESFGDLEIPA